MSLIVNHNSGFFSCCSMKLFEIVKYINKHNKIPLHVDSSIQFEWYKNKDTTDDITYEYFEHYDNMKEIIINYPIPYHFTDQFSYYSFLDYTTITPIVKKYFSPSKHINDIIEIIEQKYKLDYDNICVLFYRGNDKITETTLSEYDDYINHINSIIAKNPNVKFLIQSDETEFIERMTELFSEKSFYFKDEIRHMKKCNDTVDNVFKEKNFVFSKYYLAITIIMSKCQYIICGSGNCSIWIMFFRGNCNNVYQFLNNKMLTHQISPPPNNESEIEWVTIAEEGETITLELSRRIRYGHKKFGWIEHTNNSEVFEVSNNHFGGDPAVNIKKVLQMYKK